MGPHFPLKFEKHGSRFRFHFQIDLCWFFGPFSGPFSVLEAQKVSAANRVIWISVYWETSANAGLWGLADADALIPAMTDVSPTLCDALVLASILTPAYSYACPPGLLWIHFGFIVGAKLGSFGAFVASLCGSCWP